MGLLKAGIGALSGTLADQWREYFYCESMPENVLVTKGVKRTGGRSSNNKGDENIISNGSIIAVNEGQCMMIVEQGAIVEFTAEAGEFVWDSSTEPTIFFRRPWPRHQRHMGDPEEAFHHGRRHRQRPTGVFLQHKRNHRQ